MNGSRETDVLLAEREQEALVTETEEVIRQLLGVGQVIVLEDLETAQAPEAPDEICRCN